VWRLILSHSFFIVKNALQHLLKLLRAYDDDIAILSLHAITALAAPPPNHRCLTYSQHTTTLHKVTSHCIPLFQIVEAANWNFPIIAEDFLSPSYTLDDKHIRVEFDISQRPKVYGPDSPDDATKSLTQSVLVIPSIHDDPRSIFEILSESWLPYKYKFALMWRVRLQRLMLTLEGRKIILIQQFRSIFVLLCCHPNTAVLSHFFQDKTDLLRDFVFMVRTGIHFNLFGSFLIVEMFLLFHRSWFK
jgi:hypothetical protein